MGNDSYRISFHFCCIDFCFLYSFYKLRDNNWASTCYDFWEGSWKYKCLHSALEQFLKIKLWKCFANWERRLSLCFEPCVMSRVVCGWCIMKTQDDIKQIHRFQDKNISQQTIRSSAGLFITLLLKICQTFARANIAFCNENEEQLV